MLLVSMSEPIMSGNVDVGMVQEAVSIGEGGREAGKDDASFDTLEPERAAPPKLICGLF